MSRNRKIIALSLCAVVVLGLGAAVLYQGTLARAYRRQLEYAYQAALGHLAESSTAIAADLEKACYAGSEQSLWTISARLWRECGTARAALSALPLEGEGLSGTAAFLAQVGDYAMALAREGTTADRDELSQLVPFARQLARQTGSLEAAVLSQELPVESLALGYLGQKETPAADKEDEAQAAAATPEVDPSEPGGSAGEEAFAAMEEGFAGLPRLIYDGPFSTHLEQQSPKLLANLGHLSRDQARAAAADAMGQPSAALAEVGDLGGSVPAYLFTCGEQTAAITKQGGFVLWLTDAAPAGGQTITLAEAKAAAQNQLEHLGYRNMESSYHEVVDDLVIFNFAATRGNVVCYTDLIKVGVELGSGRVAQLDARGYVMNHTERTLPAASLSPEETRALLSPALTVQSHRLALIPSPGGEERLCYEFLCTGAEGRQVLVYRNATTGAEEDLLLLEISESGTLTI